MSVEGLRRAVEASWQGEASAGLALVLRACEAPYAAAVALRNRAYDEGWLRVHRVPARVVSVGNLVVGGTGKTPLALWLAEGLARRGHRPAIVARGYGKRRAGVVVVGDARRVLVSAAEGGDEAALMARRFDGPVIVGEDRVAAARVAIADFGATIVVLDDGFQHRRLARDVDLVVTPGAPPPRLLPAGPLREPPSALARASAVVQLGDEPPVSAGGLPVFRASLRPRSLVRPGDPWTEEAVDGLRGRRVVAVSAIARPERFARMLGEVGAEVVRRIERPDHHPWTPGEVASVLRDAAPALVVTTEKDLVKWESAPPAAVAAVRLDVEVEHGERLLGLAGGSGMVCGGGDG